MQRMTSSKDAVSVRKLINQFKELVDSIPGGIEDLASLTDRSRKLLKSELLAIIAKLEKFADDLDPIHIPDEIFDPSDHCCPINRR